MKDQIISYETAKLAKEKGFDLPCKYSINKEGYDDSLDWTGEDFTLQDMLDAKGNTGEDHFLTPTQSVLQKWLREEHSIDLWVEKYPVDKSYIPQCPILNLPYVLGYYNTYEEALEIILQEGLKLIECKEKQ